ncbi:uncharacterized protein LOC118739748 [Rhagoletis pomonella]|uniref:uncharacterized protein LOC118739748 n=1 Tax=Rhagoletis pomonella TaxID=28610 RepID=UPI001785DF73|nr:uncharacterized protein LOC118739748 [Rhagoletis pomonella]
MAGVLESLCKSIARIEEYTRQAEFVDATLEQVKVRAERLEKFYERFIEAHQKLMERDSKKANTYDHVVAVVEANYFSAQSALSTKVNALTPILVSAPILQPPLAVQVNLPYQQHDMKNTWGDFDGTLTKWSGFRDRFMAAIHNNENVSPAFKFSYLKKSLVGKAARTLGEWQLTDDNYVEAWARLKQLYDRKYPICREHLRQLLRLPTIEGAPRPNDLQRMSNVTHEVLRQLRAQGIPVESWDMMVVHILHERLDPETSKQWELQRLTETPTVKQILEFLDRQAAALANVVDVHRTRTSDARSVSGNRRELSNSGRGNRSKVFSSDSDKKASQCIACERDHALWSCDEFKALSLRAREELIRRYNLCRNCFKRGHGADNCYQGACVRCPGQMKHNSMLCPMKEVSKQALVIKESGHRRSNDNNKVGRGPVKRQRNAKVEHVCTAQGGHSGEVDDVEEEIRKVDKQLSLLDKQEQLLKKRKLMFEKVNNCNDNEEKEINLFKNYGRSFDFNLDVRPALLPTVMVRLEADGQHLGPVRALLDCGAQPNLIASSLYIKYKFSVLPASRKMVGIEGKSFGVSQRAVLKVKPWFNAGSYVEEEFWVLPRDNNWEPVLPDVLGRAESVTDSSLPLADPEYWKPGKVQVVLNVKVFAKILTAVLPSKHEGTTLLETCFGVVVCGAQGAPVCKEIGAEVSYIHCTSVEELGDLVKRFWKLDEIGSCPMRTEEEEKVEQLFLNTYSRDGTGRFTVLIPLKTDICDIGSSRLVALRRFLSLEKRLNQDPALKKRYVTFMREYEQLGHMEQVSGAAAIGGMVYYIPHHCVTKKFRVVFDASCRTDKGVSLNEVQMLGEKLQRDLAEIVMRFRRHKVAVIGDIKMMFRQVLVSRDQWDLQRIFWRERDCDPLREYWLKVVTYGMTSSAFNAVRAVVQCARDASMEFPEASKIIEGDLYMDDCITGAGSESQAIKMAKEVQHVLAGGGFEMKKWKSNSKRLIKEMLSENEEESIFVDEEKASVLGLKWNIARDMFSFVVKTPEIEGVVTKRKILGCVAQLYDPNGFISPVTILGKIIIQDLWRIGVEWDVPVSKEMEDRFRIYWEEIKYLEEFTLERWIGTGGGGKVELHGFSDASTVAYGAAIYVRVENDGMEVKSTLLVSKSRVAPMKTVSVPRLELAAAELLSRLLVDVTRAMELSGVSYTLWTDSQVVLHWIGKIPRCLKTFVANRVASIQTNTDVKRWRYINTRDNPADMLSRGMKPSEIIHSKLWIQGPPWLKYNSERWPDCVFVPNTVAEAESEFKTCVVAEVDEPLMITRRATKDRVSLIEYVDKLERAVNVVAYLLKFISNIKTHSVHKRKKRGEHISMSPTTEQRTKAMWFLLNQEQKKFYKKEIGCLEAGNSIPDKSRIESLKPELKDGLLRVHGRLKNASLDENMRHPVIIPDGSRLAWFIMDHAHRETKHGGVQVMMQFIRQKYWIPRLRGIYQELS